MGNILSTLLSRMTISPPMIEGNPEERTVLADPLTETEPPTVPPTVRRTATKSKPRKGKKSSGKRQTGRKMILSASKTAKAKKVRQQAYSKAYYAANRERILEQVRQYQARKRAQLNKAKVARLRAQ